MKIDRVKSCLGDRVHSVSIAQSYASRRDVIEKIVSYIADQGLDVDDAYLDFVRTVDRAKAEIEVRYVPVYRATALARLFWRESKENQEASEHQEFVRFSTLFYADDLNKGNRINQLDILKIIDKKAGKINEARYENADDYRYENVPLLKSGEANLTDIVLDVPLQEDEVYPLETSYILDGNEIEARVGNTLHSTKSYQRLAAQSEKWSSIERLDVEAVLGSDRADPDRQVRSVRQLRERKDRRPLREKPADHRKSEKREADRVSVHRRLSSSGRRRFYRQMELPGAFRQYAEAPFRQYRRHSLAGSRPRGHSLFFDRCADQKGDHSSGKSKQGSLADLPDFFAPSSRRLHRPADDDSPLHLI